MAALSNAQHQAAYRQRQKDEVARLKRLVKSLERKVKLLTETLARRKQK